MHSTLVGQGLAVRRLAGHGRPEVRERISLTGRSMNASGSV